MPFRILPRDDLSLNDLLSLAESSSVVKTPHVGNFYPNNLLVASAGIPVQLYDRTIGAKDTNFHPHLRIKDGASRRVGSSDVLLTHAKVTNADPAFPDVFRVGDWLADAHTKALQQALPSADITIFSDYLREHADIVLSVLEVAFGCKPNLWCRYVDADGAVRSRQSPASFSALARSGIYSVNDDRRGWIIPNELNVLVDAVVESRRCSTDTDGDFGRMDVYHLSGPDMIHYIDSDDWRLPDMSGAYDAIRDGIEADIPAYMHFHIVPVAHLRFAVPADQQEALDAALGTLLRVREFNRRTKKKKEQWYPHMYNKQRRGIQAQNNELAAQLQSALDACPAVFYDIAAADYFSQYDLLDGRELYTPELIKSWSMKTARWAKEKFFQYAP